jgi:hypothetical protein
MARRAKVFRAGGALLEKIDEYGRAVEKQTGVKVARAAVVEALIRLGLRAVAKPRKSVDLEMLAGVERKK